MKIALSVVLMGLVLASCGGYPRDIDIDQGLGETDRNLFERAKFDLQRGNITQARLLLQTLIGTYPDSEFTPDAMYAAAESYYRGGTRADMINADYEWTNFQVFFPTSALADDAQMMRAMTHIRQMERADRDPQEALLAERDLETLIANYPDSDLLEETKEKLRAVQDVIAEGWMKIGNHYFTVEVYGAAASRYNDVLETYPDFSGTSEVLYRLGEILRRVGAEDPAATHYARIVREHPSSEFEPDARKRLSELGRPIPEPNEAALVRAEAVPEPEIRSLASRMLGVFGGRPGVSLETTAASILVENPPDSEPGDGEFSVDGVILDVGGPPGGDP